MHARREMLPIAFHDRHGAACFLDTLDLGANVPDELEHGLLVDVWIGVVVMLATKKQLVRGIVHRGIFESCLPRDLLADLDRRERVIPEARPDRLARVVKHERDEW